MCTLQSLTAAAHSDKRSRYNLIHSYTHLGENAMLPAMRGLVRSLALTLAQYTLVAELEVASKENLPTVRPAFVSAIDTIPPRSEKINAPQS